MKRRIEQLLNGIFEYEPVKLRMLPEEIAVQAAPGAVVRGSFRLESGDGRKLSGFLYSSSPRLVCDPVEFQGSSNEIHYQLDCSGYENGAADAGEITVCCEAGEYTLPFSVKIEPKKSGDLALPFADFDAFTALAQEDFQKAYRWFVTGAFGSWIKEISPEKSCIYEGLRSADFSYASMEEFLIGAGKKEPVTFSVGQTQLEWKQLSEPVRETLAISRDTWGFETIRVESDAGFLRPEKKLITTDEFAGSTFDLNYVLDTNLMHAGNNYARLTLSTVRQKVQIEFTVRRGHRAAGRQGHVCKTMIKKIEALYISFRLQKIDLPAWIERSVSVLGSYKRAGGNDPFADLFLVQLLFADGKRQKAYKLLEEIEAQKHRLDTVERYAYYLYLTTFFYQEDSYVDRVEEEITRMFGGSRTSWKLQWILLYLQESCLEDETVRYEAVAEQFACGCRSRIMYVEAWQILKQNPFLMRRLGAFELHLLRFAKEEEELTAEIIRQTAGLTVHCEEFDRTLYEVLQAGYRLCPTKEVVKAICQLLIRGRKKEPEYFRWYEKGVEQNLRITGLYEAYMETMDCQGLEHTPQIIRMYFAYDTSLDYRRRAAIYRNIAENQENDPQTWRHYRAAIEKFTLDQLEALHITEDLAVLYRIFLRRSTLTRQAAEKLARLLFTYEVSCRQPELTQIIVHSWRLEDEQKIRLQDGRAYIRIYDPDSTVLAADAKGQRYAIEGLGTVRRMFDNEEMLAWCAQKAPEFPGMVLYLSSRCLAEGLMNRNTLPYYRAACEEEAFTRSFRDIIRQKVMHYYLEHPREESLPEFLDRIPYLEYVKVDKTALIALLAEEGRCSEAFSLLDAYGAEGIPLIRLVRICSRMVLDLEFGENTMLTALCHFCFASGKYDDKLLRYLVLYYEGPVEQMKQIWQAARRFELDTMLLEEKIMMMLLFTRSGTQGSEPVFEAYLEKLGRKKLCRAYANLKAYEYFVKGQPVAETVFQFIEKEYQYFEKKGRLSEQEEVCRLALLQYYARAARLEPLQRQYASKLLEEFGAKGMRFAFWKQFDRELLLPYEMEGRVFVEYAANPKSTVNVYYRRKDSGEEFQKEAAENRFEGIFVREFTLLSTEELECYLEEDDGREKKRTDRLILTAEADCAEDMSRYAMLNRISQALKRGDTQTMWEELEAYLMLDYLVGEVFTLVDSVS